MKKLGIPLNGKRAIYKSLGHCYSLFHWALVVFFAIAFISSEESRKLHVIFGYSVLFLVLFRILYGFVGTKYARFSDFLYHLAQIADYLKGLLIGRPKHYIGHNPAGGL